MDRCYCLVCGPPVYEFTDKEIDDMRRQLAKQWHQSISQVTESEALSYLRDERDGRQPFSASPEQK